MSDSDDALETVQWGADAPLVTIIIPIYKVGPFVRKCLATVASQTYPNIETIIVNDATPDDSMVVVRRSLDGVPNVRIIEQAENGGLGNARNTGIYSAKGKYIFFLDSDDWLDDTTISKAVAKAELGQAQVVVIDYYKVNHASKTRAKDRSPYVGARFDVFDPRQEQSVLRIFNLAQIKLYEKAFLFEHGFRFKDGIIYEDVDWTFKVLTTATRVAIVDEPLYYYRTARPGSILSSKGSRHFDILAQYEDVFAFLRETGKQHFLETIYGYALNAVYSVLVVSDRIPNREKRDFFNKAQRIFKKARGKRKFRVMLYKRYKFDRILMFGTYTVLQIWQSAPYKAVVNSWVYKKAVNTYVWIRNGVRRRKASLTAWGAPRLYQAHLQRPALLDRFFGPVQAADVVFEAYWGEQFADSPKYLYEYLKAHHPEVKCLFALRPGIKADLPQADRVDWNTYAYRVALNSAKVWINNNNFTADAQKADDQLFIQTFHGIPLKKVGTDVIGYQDAGKQNWTALVQRCAMWDYVVTSGAHHSETLRAAFQTNAKFLEIGSPRNDCLQDAGFRADWGRKIRQHYDLPQKTRLVLYAPTWRQTSANVMLELPALETLLQRLGSDVAVLYRKHHFASGKAIDHDRIIDASRYPDGQHLCAAADMMITDYSSMALDFAATGRPAFFYVPDYDEYEQARGLYIDMKAELAPVVFTRLDALVDACADAFADPAHAAAQNQIIKDKFLEAEQPDSCRYVIENLVLPHLAGSDR